MLGKREDAYIQKTLCAKLYTMWGGLVGARTPSRLLKLPYQLTLLHTGMAKTDR